MTCRAMKGAERKGARAAHEGKTLADNPYGDERTHRGSVTYARGFWRAWRAGFKSASPIEGIHCGCLSCDWEQVQ